MSESPGFRKTHEYGQPFGECEPQEVEVLPGEHYQAPYVPGHGWFCHCGRTWPCPDADSSWAGRGFEKKAAE